MDENTCLEAPEKRPHIVLTFRRSVQVVYAQQLP